MRKRSLAFRLALVMSLIVAGALFVCWIFNNIFLEKYYMYKKQQEMIKAFETIYKVAEMGKLQEDEFTNFTFKKLTQEENFSITITLSNGSFITSVPELEMKQIILQFNNMYKVGKGDALVQVGEGDHYTLYKEDDPVLNSEYLVMVGEIGDNSTVVIRTAVESITESAQITNQFFQWVGVGSVILSVLIIVFLSKGISKPIAELSAISNRMANLDFGAKYLPKKTSSKEVDELGFHINQMSDNLEKTITELRIANVQLTADIQKKEQIDEMRKEFVSNVSHELKTPLALISGYAEGLKEGISDDPESRDFYCEVIMDETEKMTSMVKKLLTLNQLEFGRDIADIKCFDITELIVGVLNAQSIVYSQKGVTVNFYNYGPELVWGDEFKIEEVLTNYLSNALNHIDGEKIINVRYELKGKTLRVKVANTGEQIPEEDLDKVWGKFYKVDKARTREYGGSGIGLSIVKAIMDSHNQQCGVNNVDDGVEFWFELDRNI